MVTHKEISESRGEGEVHGYTIHLFVESNIEQEVSFFGCKLKKPFLFFFAKFQSWVTLSNILEGEVNSGASERAWSSIPKKIW